MSGSPGHLATLQWRRSMDRVHGIRVTLCGISERRYLLRKRWNHYATVKVYSTTDKLFIRAYCEVMRTAGGARKISAVLEARAEGQREAYSLA